MSTDEARAEAERRWPNPNTALYEGLRIGFEKGAEWAAARVSAPQVTDEMVLRFLNARAPRAATPHLDDWGDETVAQTRAALEAALQGDTAPSSPQEPTRLLRECTVCGEKTPTSHATEEWEKRHEHTAPADLSSGGVSS